MQYTVGAGPRHTQSRDLCWRLISSLRGQPVIERNVTNHGGEMRSEVAKPDSEGTDAAGVLPRSLPHRKWTTPHQTEYGQGIAQARTYPCLSGFRAR